MNRIVELALRRLRKEGAARPWQIKGFSEKEISRLCSEIELVLPDIYLDYLRAMGHRAGLFLRGTDVFFKTVDDLISLQTESRERAAEKNFHFPPDVFVFGHHEYYEYSCFLTSDRFADPPVLFWLEGQPDLEPRFDSFSAWLTVGVDDQLRGPPNS